MDRCGRGGTCRHCMKTGVDLNADVLIEALACNTTHCIVQEHLMLWLQQPTSKWSMATGAGLSMVIRTLHALLWGVLLSLVCFDASVNYSHAARTAPSDGYALRTLQCRQHSRITCSSSQIHSQRHEGRHTHRHTSQHRAPPPRAQHPRLSPGHPHVYRHREDGQARDTPHVSGTGPVHTRTTTTRPRTPTASTRRPGVPTERC